MPYRIRIFEGELSRELYSSIVRSWLMNMENMPDFYRNDNMVDVALADGNVAWYKVPGDAFFWVHLKGGGNADFHALNTKGASLLRDPKVYHPVFREIFHDLKLTRLSAFIPSPLKTHTKAALKLGFKHEGTIRKIALFDGETHDAEALGMLYEDIPPREKKARKRPGRKRRKRPRSGQKARGAGKEVQKKA